MSEIVPDYLNGWKLSTDAEVITVKNINIKTSGTAEEQRAIEFLRWTGWLDNHDRQIYEDGQRNGQKWIPVTERLPDEDGDYLVTTSSFYGATIFVTTRHFSDGEWAYDRAVTAWMPLPKPYERSEEE